MRKEHDGTGLIGRFNIDGKQLEGALSLAGEETNLYVYSDEHFLTDNITNDCVKGVLHDLRCVTLMKCITPPAPGDLSTYNSERRYFVDIFPHYVLVGKRHIGPSEKVICAIHFVIDDAKTLFHDTEAFGRVFDASELIEDVVRAKHKQVAQYDPDKSIPFPKVGAHSQIFYFTGKYEILSADTVLGKVTVRHSPSGSHGSVNGIDLKNTIVTEISFPEPVDFDDAMSRLGILVRYFGFLVGRPQNIERIELRLEGQEEFPQMLKVHWSMPLNRDSEKGGQTPHPADTLINGGKEQETFGAVMIKYLDREQNWRDARLRFFDCFAEQSTYSIDRLIAAANMFDILPEDSVPAAATLSQEMEVARDAARKVFLALPCSPERSSILLELKKLGRANLKRKILHRASLFRQLLADRLPELDMVIAQAVDCRNYYVHGGRAKIDYSENFAITHFFTETLEFVFGTADLIEAGWNPQLWLAHSGTSHPYGSYVFNYRTMLEELKGLLPKPKP